MWFSFLAQDPPRFRLLHIYYSHGLHPSFLRQ
jgi:hypothetical protein